MVADVFDLLAAMLNFTGSTCEAINQSWSISGPFNLSENWSRVMGSVVNGDFCQLEPIDLEFGQISDSGLELEIL
jgi:hypothetical protein